MPRAAEGIIEGYVRDIPAPAMPSLPPLPAIASGASWTGSAATSPRAATRLTPRERKVMTLVTTGLMNKQVAGELGVSEVTVKIHRGHVMTKMAARSLADLVRMQESLSWE